MVIKLLILLQVIVLFFSFFGCAEKKCNDVIIKPVYKCEVPPIPKKPEMVEVKWTKLGNYYCIDKQESKKLMINIYRLDSYSNQLKTILEGIKDGRDIQ